MQVLNANDKARGVRARFASDNISYGLKIISYSNLLRVGVRNACPRSWAGTQVYVEHLLPVRLLSLNRETGTGANREPNRHVSAMAKANS